MTPLLRRAAIASGLLHAALLAALLIGLPGRNVEDAPPEEQVVEMAVLEGPAQVVMKADQASDVAAPAVTAQAVVAPPSTDPTRPDPVEAPPPAPPPPQAPPATLLVTPAPSTTQAPPTQVVTPTTPPAQPPPAVPPPPDQAELPTPPIPPPPPVKPLPTPPAPTPPPPAPPQTVTAKAPPPPSQTHQPNPSTNTAADSHELDNTLAKLRSLQQQRQPPTHKVNPLAGGAPRVGGSVNGDINATLTGEQRGAIGAKVRDCWTKDTGAQGLEKLSVKLIVTVDATGVVREAEVAPEDQGRLSDPHFRAFAERAVRAPREARCSDFSKMLPRADLGRIAQLKFDFSP